MADGNFGQLVQPAPGQPNPDASPEEKQRLTVDWEQFLTRPDVRAALLQFATTVIQPPGPGQNVLGQIGLAVGAGGAAAQRVTTAQTAEEQRRLENQRSQEELDIQREGVDVRREGVGVAREGVTARREATRAGERTATAARAATAEQLTDTLANRLQISRENVDAQLLGTVIEQEFEGIDPLLFSDPTQLAAAQEQARERALARYMQLQGVLNTVRDPSLLSDDAIRNALAAGGRTAEQNLLAIGVDLARIERLRPPATAVAPQAGPGGTSPAAVSAPGAQPPSPDPVAEALQSVPAAAGPGGVRGALGTPARTGEQVQQQRQAAVRDVLPAKIELIREETFLELFNDADMRQLLNDVYGEVAVTERQKQLTSRQRPRGVRP